VLFPVVWKPLLFLAVWKLPLFLGGWCLHDRISLLNFGWSLRKLNGSGRQGWLQWSYGFLEGA